MSNKYNPMKEIPVSLPDASPVQDAVRWAAHNLRTRKECREYARHFPRGTRGKMTDFLYHVAKRASEIRAAKPKPYTPPRGDYLRHLQMERKRRLVAACAEAVRERGLESPTCSPADPEAVLRDEDRSTSLWLVGVEKKYHYSNAFGDWWVQAAWLCGRDSHVNGQVWAVRVPGTLGTVREALDWLTPGPVKKALSEGRRILRQGDVYLVEKKRGPDHVVALRGTRHVWEPQSRTLGHPEHGELHVPFPFRAYRQAQLHSNSRGAWRGDAD